MIPTHPHDWIDTHNTPQRRILDLRSIDMRPALTLGHLHYHHASPPLAEQCHDHWLVLVFLLSGQQCYRIDGREVPVRGGEMLRILPGQRYGTGPWPEQKGDLAWLILDTRTGRGKPAFGMSAAGAREVISHLADPVCPLVCPIPRDAPDCVEQVFTWWPRRNETMGQEMIRIRIATLLLGVAMASSTSPGDTRDQANRSRIERVLQWMDSHANEDAGVVDLAGMAGLSLPSFHLHFKNATGCSPKDYLLRQRVGRAAARLQANPGLTITEVAHDCGFSSSQYFATVFRRYLGIPPSLHRRRPCQSEKGRLGAGMRT